MDDFVRSNKVTGVNWLRGPVDKIIIRIKLKRPDDVISLPKFEDYTNETSNISLQNNIEEFTFKWQEKCFSEADIQRYKDVHNCLTKNELAYNEIINSKETSSSKVFTYIHQDFYMPLPGEKIKKSCLLSSCLERLGLEDVVGRIGDAIGGKSDSECRLFKSQENIDEDEEWTAMHIVFDNSDYNEETVLIKQEAILLSLYHNRTHNYLILTPDVNQLDSNPYVVETSSGDLLGHLFEVQVDFGDQGGSEELETLLTKLYMKWEKKHKYSVNFVMPPLGKTNFYVTIDIISTRGFKTHDLYIKYDIKLPESIQCNEPLHGRSAVTEASETDGVRSFHFGHLLELSLEVNSGMEPPPLKFYFEAISTDFWHRHRTEGYAYHQLPLTPGEDTQELRCIRPDEKGAEERRFFLGGCHLIKDLEVLSNPELQNGDYVFIETGILLLRSSIISQRSFPAAAGSEVHYEASTASALLLGAEAALRKYRKARARLAQATTTPE